MREIRVTLNGGILFSIGVDAANQVLCWNARRVQAIYPHAFWEPIQAIEAIGLDTVSDRDIRLVVSVVIREVRGPRPRPHYSRHRPSRPPRRVRMHHRVRKYPASGTEEEGQ